MDQAITFGGQKGQLFDVLQTAPLFFEAFVFADRELDPFQLVDLKSEDINQLQLLRFILMQSSQFAFEIVPTPEGPGDILAQRGRPGERIEQVEMRIDIEERLLITLTMN